MKSSEPRQNFIFFMMGYISCNLNTNGVTEPNTVHFAVNELLEKFLNDQKIQQLSQDEKKYVEQSEKWIDIMHKKYLERMR